MEQSSAYCLVACLVSFSISEDLRERYFWVLEIASDILYMEKRSLTSGNIISNQSLPTLSKENMHIDQSPGQTKTDFNFIKFYFEK